MLKRNIKNLQLTVHVCVCVNVWIVCVFVDVDYMCTNLLNDTQYNTI